MQFFRIPIRTRFTSINGALDFTFARFTHWMTIDGIGVRVGSDMAEEPAHEVVRQHLIGEKDDEVFIAADTLNEALDTVSDWPGYNTGDGKEEHRAVRIDPEKPILELPPCGFLAKNCRGEHICGEQESPADSSAFEDHYGIHGKCFVTGFEPTPPRCVVQEFLAQDMPKESNPFSFVEFGRRKFPVVSFKIVPA